MRDSRNGRVDPDKLEQVRMAIKQEVLRAVEDGYSYFTCGFAQEADLIFADVVAGMKAEYPIKLEALVSHWSMLSTRNETFRRLILSCDAVGACAERYSSASGIQQSRFLVESGGLILFISDGISKPSLVECYACALQKEIDGF